MRDRRDRPALDPIDPEDTVPGAGAEGLDASRIAELEALVRRADTGGRVARRPARMMAAETHPADEHTTVVALLAGAVRSGAWEPPARISVYTVMGGAELDFREADMLLGVTEVQVFALMGGAKILVPPDVDLEVDGTGFMGGFENASNRADEPDAPLLRVTGFAVMGGVEVKVRKRSKKKGK